MNKMGFRYELRLTDGDDAGTFETGVADWQIGDVFIGQGNRKFRICAMVPLERIEEFVDRPLYGVWEVEPV
jgi:hypothetical protein